MPRKKTEIVSTKEAEAEQLDRIRLKSCAQFLADSGIKLEQKTSSVSDATIVAKIAKDDIKSFNVEMLDKLLKTSGVTCQIKHSFFPSSTVTLEISGDQDILSHLMFHTKAISDNNQRELELSGSRKSSPFDDSRSTPESPSPSRSRPGSMGDKSLSTSNKSTTPPPSPTAKTAEKSISPPPTPKSKTNEDRAAEVERCLKILQKADSNLAIASNQKEGTVVVTTVVRGLGLELEKKGRLENSKEKAERLANEINSDSSSGLSCKHDGYAGLTISIPDADYEKLFDEKISFYQYSNVQASKLRPLPTSDASLCSQLGFLRTNQPRLPSPSPSSPPLAATNEPPTPQRLA